MSTRQMHTVWLGNKPCTPPRRLWKTRRAPMNWQPQTRSRGHAPRVNCVQTRLCLPLTSSHLLLLKPPAMPKLEDYLTKQIYIEKNVVRNPPIHSYTRGHMSITR